MLHASVFTFAYVLQRNEKGEVIFSEGMSSSSSKEMSESEVSFVARIVGLDLRIMRLGELKPFLLGRGFQTPVVCLVVFFSFFTLKDLKKIRKNSTEFINSSGYRLVFTLI